MPRPPAKSALPQYFTKKSLAERLSVCEHTIHRAIQSGDLACSKFGRAVRIREDDATAWAESMDATPRNRRKIRLL